MLQKRTFTGRPEFKFKKLGYYSKFRKFCANMSFLNFDYYGNEKPRQTLAGLFVAASFGVLFVRLAQRAAGRHLARNGRPLSGVRLQTYLARTIRRNHAVRL
jgi:hypothetical protein